MATVRFSPFFGFLFLLSSYVCSSLRDSATFLQCGMFSEKSYTLRVGRFVAPWSE